MPNIGDTVTFHFIASMPQHVGCADTTKCKCVELAFVRRPAIVVDVYEDDELELDVAFEHIDHDLIGNRDATGELVNIPSRQGHVRKATMVPIAAIDSGTWTGAEWCRIGPC